MAVKSGIGNLLDQFQKNWQDYWMMNCNIQSVSKYIHIGIVICMTQYLLQRILQNTTVRKFLGQIDCETKVLRGISR